MWEKLPQMCPSCDPTQPQLMPAIEEGRHASWEEKTL